MKCTYVKIGKNSQRYEESFQIHLFSSQIQFDVFWTDTNISIMENCLNCTWNLTALLNFSSSSFSIEAALNYANIVSYSLVLTTGVVGNMAVLFLFLLRWEYHKPYDIYIVCLGLADLLGVIVLSKKALYLHLRGSFYHLGVIGCQIDLYLSSVSITVSAATLVAISVDRYIGIKWPLRKYLDTFKTIFINALIWLYGFAVGVFFLFKKKVHLLDHGGVQTCMMNYTDDDEEKQIIFSYFVLQSGIPLLLLVTVYSLIVYELYSSVKIFRCSIERQARFLQNKKTTKLVFCTVVLSIVCWTPSRILYLIYVMDEHFMTTKLFKQLYSFLQMLTTLNNCLNPVIYSKHHFALRKQLSERFQSMSTIRRRFSSTISKRSTIFYPFIRRTNTLPPNGDRSSPDDIMKNRSRSESRVVLENAPTCSSPTKICLFAQKINDESR